MGSLAALAHARRQMLLRRNDLPLTDDACAKLHFKDKPSFVEVRHWTYFPHVTPAVGATRFFERFEALQGRRQTFYSGGLLAFELVETVLRHARNLVETHFR